MEKFGLNILLGGDDYAFRMWPAVPRIGEHLSLVDKETGRPRTAIVKAVVWGVRETTAFGKQTECDIYVLWDAPEVPRQ